MSCCLCGNDVGVKYCSMCQHSFCETCRALYFDRGLAAFKELLTRKPPRHCRGHKENT